MKNFGRAAALTTLILLVATLAPAGPENATTTAATCAPWSTGWTGRAAWTPWDTARR